MKALIITFGSTGDVYPMIGLAKALHRQGHEVCLATSQIFAQEIEHEHIPFHPLPPDWTFADFTQFTELLCSTKNQLKQFGYIFDRFAPFVDEIASKVAQQLQAFDILIATYLFPFFKVIAEQQHKPCVTVAFCHNTVPRLDRPPENILALPWLPQSWQHTWNTFWWRCADYILTRRISAPLKKHSRTIAIKTMGSFIFDSAEHVIVASPQALLAQAKLMDHRFHITGYLRHQSPVDPAITAKLDTFCHGETAPILTFGSMAAHDGQEQLNRLLSTWPNERKLIVQAGWADFNIPAHLTSNVLRISKMSHDHLFAYASVVIHHGGAGTTASVLHAGKPHIIIPHLGDQFFWAHEIVEHGLGLELNYKHWPRHLLRMIEQVEQSNLYRTRVAAMAQQLQLEDGAHNAVRVLEAVHSDPGTPASPSE